MTFQIVSSLLVDDFKNNGGKYVKDDALERNLLDEDLDSTYKQLEQSLGG